MNSATNNQACSAALAHSVLPPLPVPAGDITLNWGTPQQRLAFGFSTEQMDEHARAAWNLGLSAGLLNAPTVHTTSLLELRDQLASAAAMNSTLTLSPAAADALHLAMTTSPQDATAVQVVGYIEPKDMPRLGNCRATLWASKQSPDALAVYLTAPAVPSATDVCAEMRALCSSCGGTGDVTRVDGKWLGTCNCGSAK